MAENAHNTHTHTNTHTTDHGAVLDEIIALEEPFTNILSGFNETCMIITVIFLILFMYKEEIMRSKFVKGMLK